MMSWNVPNHHIDSYFTTNQLCCTWEPILWTDTVWKLNELQFKGQTNTYDGSWMGKFNKCFRSWPSIHHQNMAFYRLNYSKHYVYKAVLKICSCFGTWTSFFHLLSLRCCFQCPVFSVFVLLKFCKAEENFSRL